MEKKAKTIAKATVEATIIRADGTREELGVIASSESGLPGTVQWFVDHINKFRKTNSEKK